MNENTVNENIKSAILERCYSREVNKEKDKCIIKLKAILDSSMLGNKFVTIYNFAEGKFIFTHKLDEVLGYNEDVFTLENLYNLPEATLKITPEEDAWHIKRCDKVMCKMITQKYFVNGFEDCYEITFRVRHANGHILTMRRSCYLFEIDDENMAKSHIDIWEVIPDTNFTHVCVNILSKDAFEKNTAFYNTNLDLLGIKLTERQYQILHLKDRRKINKEIAEILNITSKTLDNHINKLMKALNLYCEVFNVDYRIYNSSDILHFTKAFGLYPRPYSNWEEYSLVNMVS